MMKLRKSRINLAVGAVLGAAALIPATSFGWSVQTNQPGLSTTSGGDTLLFPIYTTAVGATTSFSTTNTSDQTIVAKIRFREQEKSMDVLDFLVVYSPYDNFSFSVAKGDAERPTMSWNDTSCVVGPATSDGTQRNQAFPPPNAPFVTTNEQMAVGHLEVLGMADITNVWVKGSNVVPSTESGAVSLAAAAKHGPDGKPANCTLLRNWLASPANVAKLNAGIGGDPDADPPVPAEPVLADVDNVLVGRYVITKPGQGIEGGSDAIGIRDSNVTLSWETGLIQITAQSNANCVNCIPTLSGTEYAWAGLEWDHPHLGEMPGLNLFQLNLYAENILGDWSNNPANFVGVDWVLSFPNKYAYLDYINADLCPGGATSGKEWCLLNIPRTFYGNNGTWTGTPAIDADTIPGSADLCLRDNRLTVWDREEKAADEIVNVSPGTRTTLDVCEELQVFTIATEGNEVQPSEIQTAERRGVITVEGLEAIYGWANMSLSWPLLGVNGGFGDAMTGIIFTTRATEDPTVNNGSITDLQKQVNIFAPPTTP